MDYKKDTQVFGAILGIVIPIIGFLVIYGIAFLVNEFYEFNLKNSVPSLMLAAIALNLLPIRYYFVKLKFELTGRGILLLTFIYVVVYFLVVK